MSTNLMRLEEGLAPLAAYEPSVEEIVARVEKVHEIKLRVMKEGIHYGKIPGIDKPALLEPGADVLGLAFCLSAAPDQNTVPLEDIGNGHIRVKAVVPIIHFPTGRVVAVGVGVCSTLESKYRYREDRGADEPTGVIVPKKYWKERETGADARRLQEILAEVVGTSGRYVPKKIDDVWVIVSKGERTGEKVENPNIADLYNTVAQMAIKRAKVKGIRTATAASDVFTVPEDTTTDDDHEQGPPEGGEKSKSRTKKPSPKPGDAEAKAKQEGTDQAGSATTTTPSQQEQEQPKSTNGHSYTPREFYELLAVEARALRATVGALEDDDDDADVVQKGKELRANTDISWRRLLDSAASLGIPVPTLESVKVEITKDRARIAEELLAKVEATKASAKVPEAEEERKFRERVEEIENALTGAGLAQKMKEVFSKVCQLHGAEDVLDLARRVGSTGAYWLLRFAVAPYVTGSERYTKQFPIPRSLTGTVEEVVRRLPMVGDAIGQREYLRTVVGKENIRDMSISDSQVQAVLRDLMFEEALPSIGSVPF